MNLLRYFARTRQRLGLSALVLFLAAFGAAPMVADYVRESSTSVGQNIVIMTSLLFVALVASVFAGILLADIFLPWHWRRRIILGEIIPPPSEAVGLEAVNATKAYMLPFSALVVGFMILSAYSIELVTQNFYAEYQKVGYFRTVMRSDDETAKLRLIEAMGEVQIPEEVENAVDLLDGIWRDGDYSPELRLAALDSIGVIARSLTTSLEAWEEAGQATGRWEAEVLATLREGSVPDLLDGLGKGNAEYDEAALLAIGMMQDRKQIERFTSLLATADVTDSSWSIAVVSLGYMRSMKSLGALVKAAPRVEDAKLASLLAWAVARISKVYPIDPDEDAPEVFTTLVDVYGAILDKGNLGQRCAAAEVFRYVGDADIATHLFAAFDKATPDEMCRSYAVSLRRTPPTFVGSEAKLRMAVLYAFRQIGKGHAEVWKWAEERAQADDLDDVMKGHLNNLASTARGR